MWADERKKVVNKVFSEEWAAGAKPSETVKKPTETGVALLSRYSVQNGKGGFRGFQGAEIQALFACSACKYSRISEIRAEGGEKSNILGAIALIGCDLRIEEQLYKK